MPVDSKTELVVQEDNLLRIVDASRAFQAGPGAITNTQRAKAVFVSFGGRSGYMPRRVMRIVILLAGLVGACGSGSTPVPSAPSSPNVVSLSGTGVTAPLCGKPDDRLVHIPPSYTLPLAPPVGIGQTLVDTQYGCPITRLTTFGEFQASQSNHHNYSTITPFNADSSRVMLSLTNGSVLIVDLQGN